MAAGHQQNRARPTAVPIPLPKPRTLQGMGPGPVGSLGTRGPPSSFSGISRSMKCGVSSPTIGHRNWRTFFVQSSDDLMPGKFGAPTSLPLSSRSWIRAEARLGFSPPMGSVGGLRAGAGALGTGLGPNVHQPVVSHHGCISLVAVGELTDSCPTQQRFSFTRSRHSNSQCHSFTS